MISAAFQRQVATGGLRFEAYLPPALASWVIELVEKGVFHSPSEAVFVAMQTFEDLDQHPEVKSELLRAVLAHASKEAEEGNVYTAEEVMARFEKRKSLPPSEPAIWDRSIEEPLFKE
ncbi:MAG: hypothetical protein WBO16_06280 [Gammaproteobacteria bacterium]